MSGEAGRATSNACSPKPCFGGGKSHNPFMVTWFASSRVGEEESFLWASDAKTATSLVPRYSMFMVRVQHAKSEEPEEDDLPAADD